MKHTLTLFFCSFLFLAFINDSLYCNAISNEIGSAWQEVGTRWVQSGMNASISVDSTYYVNNIPQYIVNNGQQVPSAIVDDDQDDATSFQGLINWIKGQQSITSYSAQVFIPSGTYNFSNQLIMHSNISLKGAGSDQTILEFKIKADSTTTSMSAEDCRKDAILILGTEDEHMGGVGIEDLKILRVREGVDPDDVYHHIYEYTEANGCKYFGNNIAFRYANNCWVKGVESSNTFRNHITMQFSEHVTISGVYFHHANKYCDGGVGYGVGIWDSSSNLVENSIFEHLRHGVTISDKSWYNVVSYNYFRDQYSTVLLLNVMEMQTKWSDITIHGEPFNTWKYEDDHDATLDPTKRPTYNLIEGNDLEYLCVDSTHRSNGVDNVFHRNRATREIHVQGYDGFPDAITTAITLGTVATVLSGALYGSLVGGISGTAVAAVAAMAASTAISWSALQFCCQDCAIMRVADQLTYGSLDEIANWFLEDELHETYRFLNQPKQIFVNNYAKQYNWWKCQIQDFPVRMHSEIGQYQANTYKRYVNFWGRPKGKTINDDQSAYSDKSYYQPNQSVAPAFWPIVSAWPYNYLEGSNPSQLRWYSGGKKTVGVGEEGFLQAIVIPRDTTWVGDLNIAAGSFLKIEPGVTVKFGSGNKINMNGYMQAIGTADNPIVFTAENPSAPWGGINIIGTNSAALPVVEMSYCEISKSNTRGLTMKDYTAVRMEECIITQNTGYGGIYSENGELHIRNSKIENNILNTGYVNFGAGMYLQNTDAEIYNTFFMDNVTQDFGGGAIHIAADADTSSFVNISNCYFSGNEGSLYFQVGWAIHSTGYCGKLTINNCSFINQGHEIFNSLDNDLCLTNCLFWNNGNVSHQLSTDEDPTIYKYRLSHCYIPNSEQNLDDAYIAVTDTVFTSQSGLTFMNQDGLVKPLESSMLVNAGGNQLQSDSESIIFTDILGNPRINGKNIDIGAVEAMKPEIEISDTEIDFGWLDVFCEADSTIRITNNGTEDLVLQDIVLPMGYSVDQTFPLTIPTGYSANGNDDTSTFADLKITFSPTYHKTDYLDEMITFTTNDSLFQEVSIQVSGVGRAAELTISSDSLRLIDFPANNTPSFGREFIVFKNTGNTSLVIDSLRISDHFEYAYSECIPDVSIGNNNLNTVNHLGARAVDDGIRKSGQLKADTSASEENNIFDNRYMNNNVIRNTMTWSTTHVTDPIWYIEPGDSAFFHVRYVPNLVQDYAGHADLASNDPYLRGIGMDFYGKGIPLEVTDNPTELQVLNVITSDTLWVCPEIYIHSPVTIETDTRLTIKPLMQQVIVQADSTCGFNVMGELHARSSYDNQYQITFCGADMETGWKGFVYKDNGYASSRMDSVTVVNANDYNRLDVGGGAIHCENYNELLVKSSVFRNNRSDVSGGAVYLENGTVYLEDSLFQGNTAPFGGAISDIGNSAELHVATSSFETNDASQSGGAIFFENGSGAVSSSIFVSNESITGGAIAQMDGQVDISADTMFLLNSATDGGAISVCGAGAKITIDESSFEDNQAGESGGAVYAYNSEIVSSDVIISSCSAISSGGAIHAENAQIEISDAKFVQCSVANGNGGALALINANYYLAYNSFQQCKTDSLSGMGGALFIDNPNTGEGNGQLRFPIVQRMVRSNLITQSEAVKGGGIYQKGNGSITGNALYYNKATQGGGIYLVNSIAAFDNNTIADNFASGPGGAIVCDSMGIEIKNTLVWGNEQAVSPQIHCNDVLSLSFVNCDIERISSEDYGISGDYGSLNVESCLDIDPEFDGNGSMFPFQLSKTSPCVNAGIRGFMMDGMDVKGNPRVNSDNGTAIIDIGAYEFCGSYWEYTGAMINDQVNITYSPTHFINDLVVEYNGVLHIDPGVSFLAQNNVMIIVRGSIDAPGTDSAKITFGTSPGNPTWYGFRFVNDLEMGSALFSFCTFRNGRAYPNLTHAGVSASNGGVIFIDGYPEIQIANCTFRNNQAVDNGGAIYMNECSPLQISNCVFDNNQAFLNGGAIYLSDLSLSDSLQIVECTFTSNKVKNGSGGAIYAFNAKTFISECRFSLNTSGFPFDNVATSDTHGFCGGAISIIQDQANNIFQTIQNNQFHANSAIGMGGSIYVSSGEQHIRDNHFYNSQAMGFDKSGSQTSSLGGGAIGTTGSAISEVFRNVFEANYAYTGGAILSNSATTTVSENVFEENSAHFGGAIQLYNTIGTNYMRNNLFSGNTAKDSVDCAIGGAIRILNSGTNVEISLSKFINNSCDGLGGAIAVQNCIATIIVNNLISNNNAVSGAGLYLEDTETNLMNCTIVNNTGAVFGGGLFLDESKLVSGNNLFWANTSPNGMEVKLVGYSSMESSNSFLRLTDNSVVYLYPSRVSFSSHYGESEQPPLFINNSHNYNLKPDSPCVNNGDTGIYHTSVDLNDRNRVVGGSIDIGAYEYSGITVNSDIVDSLTVWDDTCITVTSPISLNAGNTLVIDDNVTVFFEENGSLSIEDSVLEIGNNVSLVSEATNPEYNITLTNSSPLTMTSTSILGVKMKTDATLMRAEDCTFQNSFLSHSNESLSISNSEFIASNIDAVCTAINNDSLLISINGSYFHDKPDSAAIRIYSYPNFEILNNHISNYNTGLALYESGHGGVFVLGGNCIEGNQYGYGIQAYHSNVDMSSSGIVRNNNIGLGGLRNSVIYLIGNKENPYQSFCNNYSDELAFTHDSFPKDIRYNLIYDSINPSGILLRCSGCDEIMQHDVSYNFWNTSNPLGSFVPIGLFSYEPMWDMEASTAPAISEEQDLFELAKFNLRIGHNDLAELHLMDLITSYPNSQYLDEAAKLLIAACGSDGDDIFELKHFYATEPNLHLETGIDKLADYLVNYCNLKLGDYQSVVDWYESVILNPPSMADSIYAVIDLAYTYLLMSASNTRNKYVGKYAQLVPRSMQSFRHDLDSYVSMLLHEQPSSISEVPQVVNTVALHQNYPNPFNPTTTISFDIPEDGDVKLDIYNIRGQLVKNIEYQWLTKGNHSLVWDGKDRNNQSMSSGVYFYSLSFKGHRIVKKMCIVK